MKLTLLIIIITTTIQTMLDLTPTHYQYHPTISHKFIINKLKTQHDKIDEIRARRKQFYEHQDQQFNTRIKFYKNLFNKYNLHEDFIRKKQLEQIARAARETLEAQKKYQEDILKHQVEQIQAIEKLSNLQIKNINEQDKRLNKRLKLWRQQNKIQEEDLDKQQQDNQSSIKQSSLQQLKNELNSQIANFKRKDHQIQNNIQNDIQNFKNQNHQITENHIDFANHIKQSKLARKQHLRRINELILKGDKRYISNFYNVLGI